jgi:hypothetical protein
MKIKSGRSQLHLSSIKSGLFARRQVERNKTMMQAEGKIMLAGGINDAQLWHKPMWNYDGNWNRCSH